LAGDRDQRSTRLDERGRTSEHVATDDVVDQVDRAECVVPAVPLDVDEFVGAQVEHALARVRSPGSDDMGAGPAGERPWSNCACHAVSAACGMAAASTKSTVAGFAAKLRTSMAT